jgi:hypothetical protein
MEFKGRPFGALALVVMIGASLVAGCSSDSNNNENPGPTIGQFNDSYAIVAGELAGAQVEAVLGSVPAWASGDLSGGIGGIGRPALRTSTLGDTAVFVPSDTAWVRQDTLSVATIADTTEVIGHLSAKYRTDGIAHEDKDDWNQIGAIVGFSYENRTAPQGEFHQSMATLLDFGFDLSIVPTPPPGPADVTGPMDVTGTGTSSGTLTVTIPGADPTEITIPASTYTIDLTGIDDGSCPTGTVVVHIGTEYIYTATYNGTSTISWVLMKGATEVDSGTSDCSLEP